ncbi:prion-like-(Q/N-rich) domain-bearing protein 25 [Cotesia glomerata]|uniref:prion-like-(Q/N-rich) domain-bearing protein 25 n=1 Tax=Cotesia glomerata TaxID=32391 RepID=UPI001D0320D4|nr:prion-like-(Q/N-rich) domain-bearing protein 25 [Cotesia glomerata]
MCIDNECRCSKNYSERENHCLPVIGSLRCHYDGQCAIIKFAKCSKNSYCVCSLNTTVINNTLCGPVSDSHCAADNDCVNNSVCKNNKCQCSSKYVTINGNQCVHPYIGMPCTDDDYCNFYINHTICSPENNCACSQNSYYYNRTLHSLFFNMSFTNYEDCKAEQAFCLDNKCYHHSVANFSDKSCSEDKNCFGSLLGELCDINEDCFPYNSVCSDRKCKCAMNYRNNSIFSCLPSMLNQNCWINSHCSAIPNAECSDYQCICKAGYVESNQKTCSPLLGTQCTEHDECTVRYSICFDEKCECTDYFTPLSNDRCGSGMLSIA